MSTKETLEKALAELKARGRTRSVLFNRYTGNCCALGAIGFALGVSETDLAKETADGWGPIRDSEAARVLGLVADEKVGQVYGHETPEYAYQQVYRYNDSLHTSDEDIYALYEAAIAAAS